ncbi:MAG: 2OG-Fe dioxygenase family protein [Alphaproteobacteria bacterium]|nr:2OG-Fe dioxygenase family protein [Alphaproteobacteria bacterium]
MSNPLTPVSLALVNDQIERTGFAYVRAPEMQGILETAGLRDWTHFAASWDDLGVDTYMADGGRYRRRRFACYRAASAGIIRKPHQPHYQSRDYNPLNGGVQRWFEPVTDEIGDHPSLRAILATCYTLFDGLTTPATRPPSWHVEVHQFRIEARPGQDGRPTPEGMHQDGVDWVLVLLVNRVNISSGETSIGDLAQRPLGSFTLTDALDCAVTDDNRVYHGVTPVTPVDPARPAYRDVLVVTFRRE